MIISSKIKNRLKPISLGVAFSAALMASYSAYGSTDNGSAISSAELQQNAFPYPTDLIANANATQLANYAWRLFLASNQGTSATLTNGAGRGSPVTTGDFIDTGRASAMANPLVWESFYHRTEAFPYYATSSQKPAHSPVGQIPTYYTYYKQGSTKVAYTITPSNGGEYVNLDENNQISQNTLYYRDSNDPDFPMLYMAKVNAQEVGYVWDIGFSPSGSKSFVFPNNVIEVKSAWRRVQDIKNSNPDDYHQAMGTYYTAGSDEVPHAQNTMFALVALHIIQKTANYQSFIFTTFEHVNAVTRNNRNAITDPAYQTKYSSLQYNNGTPSSYTANAYGAYTINEPGLPSANNRLTTYSLPNAGPISTNYTTVVQPKTITKEVNDVNNQVYTLIKGLDATNVWANYRLKGVQATPTNDQNTANFYLANIVVESSQPGVQLFTGGVRNPNSDGLFINDRDNTSTDGLPSRFLPNGNFSSNISVGLVEGQAVPAATYTMGGCQGCHGRAQQEGRDFSFLASGVLGAGKEVDSVPASSMSDKQKAAHMAKMLDSSNYDQ